MVFKATGHPRRSELSATAKALTHRLRTFGVDASATSRGVDEVVVSIPGMDKPTRRVREIGQTDQLLFRPVLCYAPPYRKPATAIGTNPTVVSPQKLPAGCTSHHQLVTTNLSGPTGSALGVHYAVGATPALATYPTTSPADDAGTATVLLPGLNTTSDNGGPRYLLGPAELTGHIVKKAVAKSTALGQWVVGMRLTAQGTTGWNAMAEKYFHEVIGIELDGVVQSAPLVLPAAASFTAFDGSVQISGNFTKSQARRLAMAANWGALPVHLEEVSARAVGTATARSKK